MKIGFCGTVSVGKTTLVNALAELPEFKEYQTATERSKYLRDLGIPLNTDSTVKGQTIFLAERAAELMNEKIITDRTVIDVMAFTMKAESISLSEYEVFEDYAKLLIEEYDHIFYVSPKGVEIEDNGVRETNSGFRDGIDVFIQYLLYRHRDRIKNLTRLNGSTEERVKTIQDSLVPQYL